MNRVVCERYEEAVGSEALPSRSTRTRYLLKMLSKSLDSVHWLSNACFATKGIICVVFQNLNYQVVFVTNKAHTNSWTWSRASLSYQSSTSQGRGSKINPGSGNMNQRDTMWRCRGSSRDPAGTQVHPQIQNPEVTVRVSSLFRFMILRASCDLGLCVRCPYRVNMTKYIKHNIRSV